MTLSAASKSDRIISDLVAAANKGASSAPEETEAVDYDWESPAAFTLAELENLETFATQAGIEISKALSGQIHEQVELQSDKPAQYYAEKLPLLDGEAAHYSLALATDGAPDCGLIAIPAAQAIEWITKVVGGSAGASEQDKQLSSLELALLHDIFAAVAKAFSDAFRRVGGGAVRPGPEISAKAELPGAAAGGEYVLLSFRIGREAQQPAVSIVLTGEVLAPAGGAGGGKQDGESPEASRKKMLAHVNLANVEGYVRLGTVSLTIREIVGIEEGDVLLIDKKMDEPAELVMEGKTILSGYPARYEGQYALQIAGSRGKGRQGKKPK